MAAQPQITLKIGRLKLAGRSVRLVLQLIVIGIIAWIAYLARR